MAKPKPNPQRDAEDELFKRATPAARALLKTHRKLKRERDRREWWKENQP